MLELFHDVEDLEDTEDLHKIYEVFKSMSKWTFYSIKIAWSRLSLQKYYRTPNAVNLIVYVPRARMIKLTRWH